MSRGVEQLLLGDVGGPDVLETLLDVAQADVVLHLTLDDPTLGVEHGQARAELVGKAEQVLLRADPPVVALLGLGEAFEVGLEVVLGRPCGAVDTLQLRVLLAAAPVGATAAHQLEGVAEHLGGRHVGATAQVAPGPAAITLEVVVDGELGTAHLDVGALGGLAGGATLEPDQLDLVGLVGQLDRGILVVDLPANEGLALVDDALHDLLEGLEVLGGERVVDVEVVVEAVTDGRADAQAGLGVGLLDGLGEDVRCAVPQHIEAVLLLRGHGLDDIAVDHDVGEVAQLAVDARDEDGALTLEQVGGGRLLRHLSLAPGDGDGDRGRHGALSLVGGVGRGPLGTALAGVRGQPCDVIGRVVAGAREIPRLDS